MLVRAPAAAATATTTTLTSNVNPASVGQPVTLTATVVGDAPTGTVSFVESGVTIGISAVCGRSRDPRALGLGRRHLCGHRDLLG